MRKIGALAALCLGFAFAQAQGSGSVATGTVIDEQTNAPIGGAFVMAVYRDRQANDGPFGVGRCLKTLGLYTGADGRFSFPLERVDGYSPYVFRAIAPGYYGGVVRSSDGRAWFKKTEKDYVDVLISMRKQDAMHPNFLYSSGDEFCDPTSAPKDGAAATEFMRVKLREMTQYGASAGALAALKGAIEQREAREGTSK
jgi:hypothetical protein